MTPVRVLLVDQALFREALAVLLGVREDIEVVGEAAVPGEGTVQNHVTNALAKLGARDRTQAALRARAFDLL